MDACIDLQEKNFSKQQTDLIFELTSFCMKREEHTCCFKTVIPLSL